MYMEKCWRTGAVNELGVVDVVVSYVFFSITINPFPHVLDYMMLRQDWQKVVLVNKEELFP